jgi:hypothetical protein
MLLRLLDDAWNVEMVIVERQSAMPRQGRTSIASQMTAYGAILGACAALGLRVECVAPVQWKRLAGAVVQSFGASSSKLKFGSLLNVGKAASLEHARAVPGFVDAMPPCTPHAVQIGMADAVLIGLVGWRLTAACDTRHSTVGGTNHDGGRTAARNSGNPQSAPSRAVAVGRTGLPGRPACAR